MGEREEPIPRIEKPRSGIAEVDVGDRDADPPRRKVEVGPRKTDPPHRKTDVDIPFARWDLEEAIADIPRETTVDRREQVHGMCRLSGIVGFEGLTLVGSRMPASQTRPQPKLRSSAVTRRSPRFLVSNQRAAPALPAAVGDGEVGLFQLPSEIGTHAQEDAVPCGEGVIGAGRERLSGLSAEGVVFGLELDQSGPRLLELSGGGERSVVGHRRRYSRAERP